jgi:uncharacterized phage protein (TIGR02218 family)
VKSLTSAMIGYIQSGTTTLNTCWLITRTDATVYAFTDHDLPITIGGHTYTPVDGYTPSANEGSNKLDVDNMEVVGFLDSPSINEQDVAMGKWDFATIRIFMVNPNDLTAGTYEMRAGWLGHVEITAPSQFKAELRGLTQALQTTLGDLITPTCRYDLGDSRCTVNLAPFTFTPITVTSVFSTQQFAATALTQTDGYFASGKLTWLTGLNAGITMDVQGFANAGGVVLLQLPMVENIVNGDTFTIIAGCMKRKIEDCKNKFSNVINHGGFADLPGADYVMRPGGV